jgi:hypothetical protein
MDSSISFFVEREALKTTENEEERKADRRSIH